MNRQFFALASSPLALQVLATSLAIFFLGLFGLIRERGSRISVVFSLVTVSVWLWLFCFAWMYRAGSGHSALLWAKAGYMGVAFIPAAIYHYCLCGLLEDGRFRKRITAAWVLSAFFAIGSVTTNVFFDSMYHYRWGFYPKLRASSGPLMLYFFFIMADAMRRSWQAYHEAPKGSARQVRARAMFISFAGGYVASLDFLPALGLPLYPFGYIPILLFSVLSFYSIKHYRLLTITPAIAARQIIGTMHDALIVLDSEGVIGLVNRATCGLLGCQERDLVGSRPTACMTGNSSLARVLEDCARGETLRNFEVSCGVPGKPPHTLSLTTSLLRGQTGRIMAAVCVARDITGRKQAEEALEKSEEFIKNILETVDEGFIVVDRQYRIISANKAYCNEVSMSLGQVLGRKCHEVSHHSGNPCHQTGEDCPVRRTFETGEAGAASHIHGYKNDSMRHVEIKTFPIRDGAGEVAAVIETINDVTEKRSLEEQLRHAQKMESIGTLAGGIAHDFNNILLAIVGYAGLMEMRIQGDDPNSAYLKEILAASERATRLVQSLLIFSRKQSTAMEPVSVNALLEDMRKIIFRLIGEHIETGIFPGPVDMIVLGDSGQLGQVLMNLVTNARDAMPGGGSLRIETGLREIDGEFIRQHGYGKPGRYAAISVSDTGGGMDGKTQERIFEPFFTTKDAGKGTGLGLSIVYGIVKQHRGYINCRSQPGIGTAFNVYLPVTAERPHEPAGGGGEALAGGTETVLMADDDENIRKFTKELLEGFGYSVIEARDGVDAVNKFLAGRESIDLVLLDVIMPGKSGRDAFEEIRAIQPGTNILFMSGYTQDIVQGKRIIEDGLPFLQKPAKPRELLAKIRQVLDSAKAC